MTDMKDNQQFTFYSDKISYKTVEGKNGKEYFVTGYISTGDVDLVNDVVTKNCSDSILNQFKDRTIKLDFEHEAFRGKSIIESEANKTKIVLGKAISQEVDSKGVLTTWKLNDTWKKYDEKGNVTMTFKDLWKNVEEGFYDAFSIAYIPTKTSTENREGKNIRLLDNVNLLNVALTGNPVNTHATMTAVMAKSLEYMKSLEEQDMKDVEIKGKEKKSYDEDGKHVHTSEKPMGEHNHPELEKAVADLWERVWEQNSKIDDLTHPTSNEEPMSLKDKNNKGSTMEKENKDEEVKPDAEAETPEAKAKAAEETEDKDKEDKPEKKSFAELKDKVNGLENEVKDLKKENSELKAIVEKPQHKSLGAEDAEKKSQTTDTKSVGALDAITE